MPPIRFPPDIREEEKNQQESVPTHGFYIRVALRKSAKMPKKKQHGWRKRDGTETILIEARSKGP